MTPRARQLRTRRRIRNAAGLLSLVAFLALLGSVGAVEQDLVTLLPGAIRMFGFLLIWAGLLAVAGAFDTTEGRRVPYTYRTLLKYLKTITDDFTVTLDENAYDLFIRIRLEGYSQRDALIATLGQMIPANLVLRLTADIPQKDEPAQAAACSVMVTMNRHVYTPAT